MKLAVAILGTTLTVTAALLVWLGLRESETGLWLLVGLTSVFWIAAVLWALSKVIPRVRG